MRHRKRGRTLGRSPSHRKAMLRNLASSLFLTERDSELDDNEPKVSGRVVTTLPKAKEVRPLVEKCITIARKSMASEQNAQQFATDAERGDETWKSWRQSDEWQKWSNARAPSVAARRRALQLLGNKEAVQILFETIAPRMADRDGGYTRIVRLANPRLGDSGTRAILEFVGKNDRIKQQSEKPSFADDDEQAAVATEDLETDEDLATEDTSEQESQTDVPGGGADAPEEASGGVDSSEQGKS